MGPDTTAGQQAASTTPARLKNENTRDRILALAVEALSAGGPASLRVNDIAQQVGVAVTSIYHFFGSREGLVAAAHISRYRTLSIQDFAEFQIAIEQCSNVQEFRELITSSVLRLLDSPANRKARHVRMETYAAAFNDEQIAAMLAEEAESQAERMANLLNPLKDRGWIRSEADTQAFGAFFNGVVTTHVLIEVGSPRINEAAWREYICSAILQIVPELT